MNIPDVENRLKHALAVAAGPRSIVDDVMRQLPVSVPKPAAQSRSRGPLVAAGLVAPLAIAASLIFLVLFTGTAVRLTLADIKAEVERQAWVHVRYDVGQIAESWTDLRTGESFTSFQNGSLVYVNGQSNTRLWYWKNEGVIRKDAPVQYAPGKSPPLWTPRSAWEQIVGPLEHAVAATERPNSAPPPVISTQETLNGKPAIRFDSYGIDNLGNRLLYAQLWADPATKLPVRVKTRLQLGEREKAGKDWSTGDYDFPASGPADLFAMGVPVGTPIHDEVTTAPAAVEQIVEAINRAHDDFLKNYRAIVWTVRERSAEPIDGLDIIWRDGEKLRQDHHLPAWELQHNQAPPLPQPNPAALLEWAGHSDAVVKQLMNSEREYTWRSAAVAGTPQPQVHVLRHGNFPLLDANHWPENIQWPTRHHRPAFQVLDTNVDTVAGCIGLRHEVGTSRSDYYIDSKNDYVCVKHIAWTKRGAEWTKSREYTLSELHRVAGRVVAGTQRFHGYGSPTQNISESTVIKTIDVVPFAAADYPPGIFDPAKLTTGAVVEGY